MSHEILDRIAELADRQQSLLVERRIEVYRWVSAGLGAADSVALAFAEEPPEAYQEFRELGVQLKALLRELDADPEWRAKSDGLADRTEQLDRVLKRRHAHE